MKNYELFNRHGVNYLIPFILITFCCTLWGFALDLTNPMTHAFTKIFHIDITDATMVQVAYNAGYLVMAIPAALYIRKYAYKNGVLMGLAIFALGAFLFIPAKMSGMFYAFLFSYFIMTCGLSFLETSCNTYLYAMGDEETAIRRINLGQAFNPLGGLLGMYIAMTYISVRLCPLSAVERARLPENQFEFIKNYDLSVLIRPYVAIIIAIVIMAIIIYRFRMPKDWDTNQEGLRLSIKKILSSKNYIEGFFAQFFYVGAQICCWTFIFQYGIRIFMEEGMKEKSAEMVTQKYTIYAMILFCIGRFVCTWLMKQVKAEKLLLFFSVGAFAALLGVIFCNDRNGVYCLLIVSGCMSLMFPTIFGMSLKGLGNHIKLASAGQTMAIFGGAVIPTLQASIMDSSEKIFGIPTINFSFILPAVCFILIAVYAQRLQNRNKKV